MKLLIVSSILVITSAFGLQSKCNKETALLQTRKPNHEFSVRILDRVAQDTRGHFVFSPLTTWLQLLNLAEGAEEKTREEIIKLIRYNRGQCYRNQIRNIINSLDKEIYTIANRRSYIVIDSVFDVNKIFKTAVEGLNAAKVLSLDFKNAEESATVLNAIIEKDTNGRITDFVDATHFENSRTFTTDIAYLKADWANPFNPTFTKPEPFYTYDKVHTGYVYMMNQVGYFNVTEIPSMNAKALELPLNDRLTMIFLLPNKGRPRDVFCTLKDVNLTTIYDLFESSGVQLVNVKLPRFTITNYIDNIPELINYMGVSRMFSPNKANFKGISDYKLFVSMMSSAVDIEVTEEGVSVNAAAQFLISPGNATDFFLNRPFAYLIVDRVTDAILFGGTYSVPSEFED